MKAEALLEEASAYTDVVKVWPTSPPSYCGVKVSEGKGKSALAILIQAVLSPEANSHSVKCVALHAREKVEACV